MIFLNEILRAAADAAPLLMPGKTGCIFLGCCQGVWDRPPLPLHMAHFWHVIKFNR